MLRSITVKYLILKDFQRGRAMFSTWKGQCGAENGNIIFLREHDLSAWDRGAV